MAQGTNLVNDSQFLPVFNDSGASIPAGYAVILDASGLLFVTTPTTGAAQNTYQPIGVTAELIRNQEWGAVAVRSGMVMNCVSGAAVALGASVTASSVATHNGKLITAVAAAPQVGIAFSAATAADQEIKVLIDRARNA